MEKDDLKFLIKLNSDIKELEEYIEELKKTNEEIRNIINEKGLLIEKLIINMEIYENSNS